MPPSFIFSCCVLVFNVAVLIFIIVSHHNENKPDPPSEPVRIAEDMKGHTAGQNNSGVNSSVFGYKAGCYDTYQTRAWPKDKKEGMK